MRVFFWEGIEFKLKLLGDDDDKRQLKIKRAIVFFLFLDWKEHQKDSTLT